MRPPLAVLALLLCCLSAMGAQKSRYGQPAPPPKPLPPGYTIAVHISSAHVRNICPNGGNSCLNYLYLAARINDGRLELRSVEAVGVESLLLKPGDYKAKLLTNTQRPSGLFIQAFDLLLSDNSTMKFTVTGVSE